MKVRKQKNPDRFPDLIGVNHVGCVGQRILRPTVTPSKRDTYKQENEYEDK